MKKHLLSIILALSMICALFPTVTFAKTYGDFEYEVNDDNTITITDCSISAINVVIPAKIDGLPVTTIGEGAFFDCKSLISVTLPDSVTSIGYNAFENCDNLDSVYITDLASYLNINFDNNGYSNPMYYADKLYINNQLAVTIEIPDSVTNIPINAFDGCDSLISITIPDSVKTVGSYAFSGCTGLTSINIPDSVTSIDPRAFSGCSNLKSITIPNSVKIIYDNAFSSCSSLTSITIPNSVTNIDDAAFSHCDNLKNVYFTGTEEEWNDINIRNFNDCLTNANIHYNTISVLLNGNTIAFDVHPQIINNRTMVPVRAIFEALGASVEWNQETQTVTAIKGGTTVKLTIDSDTMYVNDTVTAIDSPACIIDDRTLVPVRAVSEAFNIKAEWDENTRTVTLTSV